MSVLDIRENSIANVQKLYLLAEENDFICVQIFNKTGNDFEGFSRLRNFSIERVPRESLYESIARLDYKDASHVLWLNDDDDFKVSNSAELVGLNDDQALLPSLKIATTNSIQLIDWTKFQKAKTSRDRYDAYWELAAPLIFSCIPVGVFKLWVDYLKDVPIYLPHLDTQLNVAMCLVDGIEVSKNYEYTYDALNWENSINQTESSKRYALTLGLDPRSYLAFGIARKIDDVVIAHRAKILKYNEANQLLQRLLGQFTPIQGGGRNFLLRNFGTDSMRRRHIKKLPIEEVQSEFNEGLPEKLRNVITGVTPLRKVEVLATALKDPGASKALSLPSELVIFWVEQLEKRSINQKAN